MSHCVFSSSLLVFSSPLSLSSVGERDQGKGDNIWSIYPIAASMAATASLAAAPSGPPACAMSGRPPPP